MGKNIEKLSISSASFAFSRKFEGKRMISSFFLLISLHSILFFPNEKFSPLFQYYGRKNVLNSFPNKIYNKVLFKEVRKIHIFFALAVTLFVKIRHDHPQTWMATWKVEWYGFWRILFFPECSFCPERQLLKIIVWIWCFAFLIFFLMLGII